VVGCSAEKAVWKSFRGKLFIGYRFELLTFKTHWQALAIKLYSIVVVSMEDERTMSVVTWIKSAKRSGQVVSTVQDHVQIRDWHRYNPAVRCATVLSTILC
jgi:hypothetical protein